MEEWSYLDRWINSILIAVSRKWNRAFSVKGNWDFRIICEGTVTNWVIYCTKYQNKLFDKMNSLDMIYTFKNLIIWDENFYIVDCLYLKINYK